MYAIRSYYVTLTADDNTDPTITCPAAVAANTSDDGTGNCSTTVSLGTPTVNDNCSGTSVVAQVGGSTINTATYLFPKGSTTVTWIVTDAAGNTASCDQIVTVTDNEKPSFTCPDPQTLPLDANCQITVPDLVSLITDETDNCGSVTLSQNPAANAKVSLTDGQTTIVTITADDGNGNTVTCNVTLTADDNTPPTITCPAAVAANTSDDGTGNCSTTVSLGAPTVDDNCSGTSVVAQVGGSTIRNNFV